MLLVCRRELDDYMFQPFRVVNTCTVVYILKGKSWVNFLSYIVALLNVACINVKYLPEYSIKRWTVF